MSTATIERDEWLEAVALAIPVGACRVEGCPGRLVPQAPERVGHRTWYTAVCGACGAEVTSPDGRVHDPAPSLETVETVHVPPRQRPRDFRELAAGD